MGRCGSACRHGLVRGSSLSPCDSEAFEQAGGADSAGAAHRDNSVAGAAALAFVHQMSDATRTRHAVGMTDRNRAAGDVQSFVRDTQAVAAVKQLRGKGLVQVPEIDVFDAQSIPLKRIVAREYRT